MTTRNKTKQVELEEQWAARSAPHAADPGQGNWESDHRADAGEAAPPAPADPAQSGGGARSDAYGPGGRLEL